LHAPPPNRRLFTQGGTFFWFNVATRSWSATSVPWQRPVVGAGLLQMLNENEVAAMLWSMTDQTSPALGQADNAVFLTTLRSSLVNKPTGVYSRGYTRHTWGLGTGCTKTNVVDTGISAVEFAEYLDALDCGGFATSSINAATNPTIDYPYPSNAPICQ
jgi:hypothetical protein